MPSRPISRARATLAISPRCPRFQSVIPTRTRTGLAAAFAGAAPGPCARAIAGTAADAAPAALRNSRRVIAMRTSVSPLQDVAPPLAVLGSLDERGRFRRIADAQVLVVPLDLLAGPVGHVAQMVRFGRPAGVLEIRARHRPDTLGIVDPLDPVAGRSRQRIERHLEALESLLGQQLAVAKHPAFVADDQLRATAPRRPPACRFAVALVPHQLDRRRTG